MYVDNKQLHFKLQKMIGSKLYSFILHIFQGIFVVSYFVRFISYISVNITKLLAS